MRDCTSCRYCKCYQGDRWTPNEYDCLKAEEIEEDVFTEAWENGNADICPFYEDTPTPEEEYWDRYAYEESRYDKDEAE